MTPTIAIGRTARRTTGKPITQLGVLVTRQTGEVVLEGEAWCYMARPE